MHQPTKQLAVESSILKKISTEFQKYRRSKPNGKCKEYPSHLKKLVISAHNEGHSQSDILSASQVSDFAFKQWTRKASAKPTKPAIVKALDVISDSNTSAPYGEQIVLRLEGNGFRIELLNRKRG